MPIPDNIVRVNINWQLILGEIAVNTLNFHHIHRPGNTLDWEGDMTQRYANLVRDGLAQAWPGFSSLFPGTVALRDVTAYHLDTNGHTLHKKTALPPQGGIAGSSSQNSLPLEVATVVSLYGYPKGSYDPNGARRRGRIYLPPLSVSNCDPGGFNSSTTSLMNLMKSWLGYVQGRVMDDNAAGEAPGRERAELVVLSRKFGEASRVQQIRVDNIFDVQRRRQNAFPVAAQSDPLPTQAGTPDPVLIPA